MRGLAHTNGIESFWSMIKRAHKGTNHKFSKKHLNRYVLEFAGRHNIRELNTIDQMVSLVMDMVSNRVRYIDLIADMDWTRVHGQRVTPKYSTSYLHFC